MERPGGLQSGFILHLVFLRLCRRLYAEHQNIFRNIDEVVDEERTNNDIKGGEKVGSKLSEAIAVAAAACG